jgi:hypothetical protein
MPIYLGNTEIGSEYVDSYQLGNLYIGNDKVQGGFTYLPIPSQSALVFNVDANLTSSYPGSGSTWYNTATGGISTNLLFTGSVTYVTGSSTSTSYFQFNTASYHSTSNIAETVTNRTQCAWINTNDLSSEFTWLGYGKGTEFTDFYVSRIKTVGNFAYWQASNFAYYPSSSIAGDEGQWLNIIGVTDGTTGYLYVNGVLTDQESVSTQSRNNRAVLTDGDITGKVSMLSIYNTAFDASSAATYFNNTKELFGY